MDSSDEDRLDAYIASQNYFSGVSHYVAEQMIREFIRRVMPWVMDRIYDALQWVRRQLGW